MEQLYARNQGSDVDPPTEWPETGLEESMWRLGLSGRETYPERPGVSDCVYYMRTGFCGFGTRCRYNHPRDRAAAVAAARLVGGEFPERPGEPICQYYLKTGTCKFGTTCKFHHPRNAGGSLTNALPNIHGYPLRPGEKECSYYLKTGQCKFGITCKFHHPQPAGMSMPMPAAAPPFYPTVRSPSIPVPEQPAGSPPSYRVARPPLVPGSYVPGSYGPVLLSPGVVPMPGWGSYSGPLSPALSPGGQPGAGGGSVYGVSPLSPSTPGLTGSYNLSSSGGQSNTGTTEHKFPERPGEPECQYYLKTGNCKFGSSCKYHHPPDLGSSSVCFLGPLGLPLRPGTQPCTFYMQNGYCKFGPTCKFDHPVGMMKYSPSASSLAEIPVGQYMAGSSMVALPISSSSQDLLPDYALGSQRDTQSTRTLPSGTTSTGLTLIQSTSSINTQRSGQSSALLTSNRSLGEDDEVHHSS